MQSKSSFHTETDRRQRYLGEFLIDSGYHVILAETSPELDLAAASISEFENKLLVLLPVPASSVLLRRLKESLTPQHIVLGGNIPKDFTAFCDERKIAYIDYFKNPAIAIENAVATAEGAICEAILTSEYNLHQSEALVIGFGKCGEILADKLEGLKCNVTVSTRDAIAKARAKAYGYHLLSDSSYQQFDLLFNTAPAPVLGRSIIDQLKPDAVIIDIASAPGGTDFNYCAEKGIAAKHCPGIPGRYSPKTSAKILFDHIQEKLSNLL
ncbi:MAG: dipicolinate synthase [Lachnospiraceae bacterium]|jgi:dipicolinate synthase subunit A|nr:dipicolinate synthase [Lachnospiraceae bacterium]